MSDKLGLELLIKVRQGDPQAINQLRAPLKALVSKILKHYQIHNFGLANEIVQDVLTDLVLSNKTFYEPFNLMGYLYTISKNLICRHLRESIRMNTRNLDEDTLNQANLFLDTNIDMFEINDVIQICLNFLSKKERIMIKGILENETAENLLNQLEFRNLNVLYSRKTQVIAKFRRLLVKHGVDL